MELLLAGLLVAVVGRTVAETFTGGLVVAEAARGHLAARRRPGRHRR